jgi:hypothetical protein
MESTSVSLEGSCHCGAVRLTLPSAPDIGIKCNCSLCRRVGGLWTYYRVGTVQVEGDKLDEYIWGDRTLRTMRCRNCGSMTHWLPLGTEAGERMGVNLNNFDPGLAQQVRVRHFDGADSWTYLD